MGHREGGGRGWGGECRLGQDSGVWESEGEGGGGQLIL